MREYNRRGGGASPGILQEMREYSRWGGGCISRNTTGNAGAQ
jgi:hypothetical protein